MLACLIATSLLATPAPRPPLRPFPSWADDLAVDPAKTPAKLPLQRLLVDREVRLAETIQRMTRVVRRVNTPEGVSTGSRLDISYDPEYQRLFFHRAIIHRKGRQIDGLARAEFRSLQREAGLEDDLLDGHLSAVVILHDVRPGDVLDLAWSVEGDLPDLRGRFSGIVDVGGDETHVRLRNRLVVPQHRLLQLRALAGAPEPAVRAAADFREYLWDASPPPYVEVEPHVPSWFSPWPRVQFSDFTSWNEVARWAAPLYRADEKEPRALAAFVRSLRKLPPEEAGDRALRFVREEIRYFGLEMGSNAFRPHRPAEVVGRRFGDCKDKALLLVTLLRALGLEAHVALVSTRLRQELDRRLPASHLFDHAIVRLRLDGKDRWLDPTLTSQRGRLAKLPAPPYARALVIDESTQGLSTIPVEAAGPQTDVEETWHARDLPGSALVEVVTTWAGSEADRERAAAANTTPEKMGKDFLEFYKKREPAIEQLHVPIASDGSEEGIFRAKESYRVPDFWSTGKHSFTLDALVGRIDAPEGKRTMPLALSFPMHMRHKLRIELPPDNWDIPRSTQKIEGSGMHAELQRRLEKEPGGPVLILEGELFTTTDSIPAAEVDALRAKLDQLDELTHRMVNLPPQAPTTASVASGGSSQGGDGAWGAGVLVGALVVVLVRSHLRGRGSKAFNRRTMLGVGESAATALPAVTWAEVESFCGELRCECGKAGAEASVERAEPAVFRGSVVGIARVTCPCSRTRAVYYGPAH